MAQTAAAGYSRLGRQLQGVPPCTPRRSKKLISCAAKKRERRQGFKGGDLRSKYYPSLDTVERNTGRQGAGFSLPLCLTASAGARGQRPRSSLGDAVRPPLFKGAKRTGEPSADGGAKPPSALRRSPGGFDACVKTHTGLLLTKVTKQRTIEVKFSREGVAHNGQSFYAPR